VLGIVKKLKGEKNEQQKKDIQWIWV
jgi:hypothetical protein